MLPHHQRATGHFAATESSRWCRCYCSKVPLLLLAGGAAATARWCRCYCSLVPLLLPSSLYRRCRCCCPSSLPLFEGIPPDQQRLIFAGKQLEMAALLLTITFRKSQPFILF